MPEEVEVYAVLADGKIDPEMTFDPGIWGADELGKLHGREVWLVKIVPIEMVVG